LKRLIGIDFGTRRLGVAISDERQIVARVLCTLEAKHRLEDTVDALLNEIKDFSIEGIIIGMPLHMNGRVGSLADDVERFKTLLEKKSTYPIYLWDERLTTVQAERTLREANLSRKKRSKIIDSVTAVILLQSYLDNKNLNHARQNIS
jgi:putative Holliday junction resolvase